MHLPILVPLLLALQTAPTAPAAAPPSSAKPAPPAASAKKPELPRGQLLEKRAAAADPTQTYALYIPTSYDPGRRWPVVYILDARGRAKVAAQVFQDGAERFGYVLASSYTSASDGPIEPNLKAMQAMWNDTHALLAIDDQRVYAAGFSGTVRSSCYMAFGVPGSIAGIIGAGAGFPPDRPPVKDMPFLFYGTAGDLDFNYYEMVELDDQLTELGLPHRVELFAGDHGWMPPELGAAALGWMAVQAMRAGARPKDPALLDAVWAEELGRARALEAAGRAQDAGRRYAGLAQEFAGLRDTAEAASHAARLAGSKEAKEHAKERKAALDRDARYLREAQRALALSDGAPPDLGKALLSLRVARLREDAKKSDTPEGRAAQRLLNSVGVQTSFYLPKQFMERKRYDLALFYLDVAAEIDPEDPFVWYQRAAVHALEGKRQKALEELQKASDLGLRNPDLLEKEDAFAGLRGEAVYRQILETLKKRRAEVQG